MFAFFLFLFNITWCMCYGDYVLCFGSGVLFCCLCTTTTLCIPYDPYATYSFIFFLIYFCVLISSFICAPKFSFLPFVCFLHTWMKTFGGCGCICTICSHMCVLKCVYLTYFAIVVTIGQDSSVKHVMLIMYVDWHVISLASLFCMCLWDT